MGQSRAAAGPPRGLWRGGSIAAAVALLLLLAVTDAAAHGAHRVLRVGTSGDYAPFSHLGPDGERTGFDVVLIERYARARHRRLEWVAFRWPDLVRDLEARRFDLAASGVTVRPERSAVGRFSVPLTETGAVALVREPRRFADLAALDHPDVRIAVNRGGHLERVTRARFPRARIAALAPNAAVRAALLGGEADAAVSDTLEGPRWRRGVSGWLQLGPFSRDRKAWLVRADRAALAEDLDAWILGRENDGSLERWRRETLGPGAAETPTATPLAALLAAMDERLALMPSVAEVKRARGLAIEAPEREAVVVDALVGAARAAAEKTGRPAPDAEAVARLARVQIEVAKAVQRRVLDGPPGAGPLADLETQLRPALGRLGRRIGWLIPRLPAADGSAVARAVGGALRSVTLEAAEIEALAAAVATLARDDRPLTGLELSPTAPDPRAPRADRPAPAPPDPRSPGPR